MARYKAKKMPYFIKIGKSKTEFWGVYDTVGKRWVKAKSNKKNSFWSQGEEEIKMTRKTPVRHNVSGYVKGGGRMVRPYVRGSGTKIAKFKKLSTKYLRPTFEAEYVGTIGEIQGDPKYRGYTLATDSQDVEAIWDRFSNDPTVKDFDGFLVKVGDGDYDDVLGFPGNVAYNYKSLYRIVQK